MTFLIGLLMAFPTLATADSALSQIQSGVYWVPVPTPELARYAVFGLSEIEVRRSKDTVKIRYALPVELTGVQNEIELEGQIGAGPLKLAGALGFGECPSADDLGDCAITYKNLVIDSHTRSDILRQISRSPSELQLREAVAAGFCLSEGGEPCGFLKVESSY